MILAVTCQNGVNKAAYFLNGISTFGMSFINSRWGAISRAIIWSAFTVVTGAAALISGELPVAVSAIAATSAEIAINTASSGLFIASAIVPNNKGLNIAASVVGIFQMANLAVSNGILMGQNLAFYYDKMVMTTYQTMDVEMQDIAENFSNIPEMIVSKEMFSPVKKALRHNIIQRAC